jgi:2-iminobutanoate/2-iminopropanoate deaminase
MKRGAQAVIKNRQSIVELPDCRFLISHVCSGHLAFAYRAASPVRSASPQHIKDLLMKLNRTRGALVASALLAAIASQTAVAAPSTPPTNSARLDPCSRMEAVPARKYLRLPKEMESVWGLSQALQVGRSVYFAGVLPLDAQGKLTGSNLREQTAKVYANLGAMLGYFGLTRADIVEEVVYVTDMRRATRGYLSPRNDFYRDVVPPPPMTLIGATAFAVPGAQVEVRLKAIARCAE